MGREFDTGCPAFCKNFESFNRRSVAYKEEDVVNVLKKGKM